MLELGELQRTVAIHCLVGYKKTDRHWRRTAFGRRAPKARWRSIPRVPPTGRRPARTVDGNKGVHMMLAKSCL